MRVLILTQYFAPENTPIPTEIVNGLKVRGHQVRVLTSFPNYPEGRIFDGYRQRWRSRSEQAGVDILRVPMIIDHSQRAWMRMLNYISFALSTASARRFARGADVVYVYATQMTPALGPWFWRMTGGAPYVLHVQDLWPDSIIGSSLAGGSKSTQFIEATLNPWLRSVYRRASAVIGIAPTMVAILERRGVSPKRARLVYNWSGQVSAAPPQLRDAALNETTRLVYAGNVGDMQDLETVVRAAAATSDAGIRLTIVGDGVAKPRLLQIVEDLNAKNITFKDPIPVGKMAAVYETTDFGLVTLKELPAFKGTIPSKFQSLLAHGVPVLTTVQGDVRSICEKEQVGLTALPGSVSDMERMFREAASCTEEHRAQMAQAAWKLARNQFSLDTAMNAIETILQGVMDEGAKKHD